MSLPKIIDNKRVSLYTIIDQLSEKFDTLSIATGYRDLPGTALIIDKLMGYKKIRLLIGREPLINRHQLKKPEPDFPDKDIFDDLESMGFKPEYKATIEKIKQLKESGVLEVKVYTTNFLHAKCYIFGDYDSDQAIGVIGSSNFTRAGLTSNTELNALESDHRVVQFQPKSEQQEVGHLHWFDSFWNSEGSKDWTGTFTQILEQSAHGDMFFSPYEMYIKVLYDLYGEELEEVELTGAHHQATYQLTHFQEKNVQLLKRKLKKYKTALLCDSVGLGKTFQGIGVIKEYLHDEDGTKKRVVVICPKSLKRQREDDLAVQGLPNQVEVITLQNPQEIQARREIDKYAGVKLFVIDESHNLRKSTGSRYRQLLEWISENPGAHVLMLTATPINNELMDIGNQILLGSRGEANIIKVGDQDFVSAIKKLQTKIKKAQSEGKNIDYKEVKKIMGPIVRSISVRRTRHGIMKEYGGVRIGDELKKFPESYPVQYTYEFDGNISQQFIDQQSACIDLQTLYTLDPEQYIENCTDLKHPTRQWDKVTEKVSLEELRSSPLFFTFQLVLSLGFIPYRWRIYQKKYYGKTVEQIKALRLPSEESRKLQQQRGIYGIFRTIFLKRLESSIASFELSLKAYKEKLEYFADGVNNHNQILSVKGASDKLQLFYTDDDELDEIAMDEEQIVETIDELGYEKIILQEDIARELELIRLLEEHIDLLKKHDPKLASLKKLIHELQENNVNGGKVLLFSYFADTIEYLKQTLGTETSIWGGKNVGFVTSSNRAEADILSKRFAPIAKRYDGPEPEIDYLFATDVLSEGQNLQDCGVVINYDLHRNPVRMIQRNGRINRLGSQWDRVYIYNMHPATKIETYLKLVNRLENKIAVINATIGNDQSVLGEDANPIEFIDTVADLYSEDEQKRLDAFQKIENDTDLLAVDDEFVSDLKIFHHNPHFSAEYKHTVYHIPQHKRGQYIPHGNEDGKTIIPDYLVLGKLFDDQGGLIDIRAYSVIKGEKKILGLFEFLNIIRTSPEHNTRSPDTLDLDKLAIATQATQTENYITQTSNFKLSTMQQAVIDQLFEYMFEIDDIEIVQTSLTTSNYLHGKQLDKLFRKAHSIIKSKGNPVDVLKEIISYAHSVPQAMAYEIKPSTAQGYLYFAPRR